ncbi:hypothetical protein FRC98_04125 [Lujinxingia vulgaris]|uniref:Lipoprotein n=1 Tax=Lujinxingia vulgaris TaxID=2600176 RepID=A0A5C6X885_9DELT|nr:hypothetical protein [Lujinxingia vulgaris]TXD38092.1 hypothetical protein FRC98_04125 [Lujinxingia vulgaris]
MSFGRTMRAGICLASLLVACGDAAEGDGTPFEYQGTWVVEGARCEGQEQLRVVAVEPAADEDGALVARSLRADACLAAGASLWEGDPAGDGAVRLGDDEVGVQTQGKDVIRLDAPDGELTLRRVYPDTGPTPLPEIDDLSLSGQWLMEGYPCDEELVPQVVQVSHAGGTFSITKTLGDGCIEAGTRFVEGELDGLTMSGEGYLEAPDPWGDVEGFEVSGRVRVPEYFRLDALGVAVGFRRVLGDE